MPRNPSMSDGKYIQSLPIVRDQFPKGPKYVGKLLPITNRWKYLNC